VRVAHVNQDPGIAPGRAKGAAVHLQALREAFVRRGAEVLAIDEPDGERLAAQLGPLLERGRIDLVYERYALGGSRAAALARAAGVPHVLEVNAPLIAEAERYRGRAPTAADAEQEARLFRSTDRLLCVSRALAEYVRERSGRSAGVVVEPNAVGPEFLGDLRPAPDFCTPGRLVLGFHGRLRPWHGFDRLVALAATLLAAGVDLELALVGEGDFSAAHQQLPADRVVQAPWVEPRQVARYVARFDLVALPYGPDAPLWFSPLKLAEAMAAGAVPLVSDLGDLPEVVRDRVDGRVCPAGDAAAFAAAALELARDPALRTRFAAAARLRASAHTWDGMAERLLDFARERTLLGRPGRVAR
jgi:glycosyltransferase involved in cell wall biosynthesis